MVEIWKDIDGFDGFYKISNYCKIKSEYTNKILKPTIKKNGYYGVTLYLNGKGYAKEIHRLLGEHFITKIEGKNYINHIDNNKLNNHLSNLEWVTQKENIHHSLRQGRMNYMVGVYAGAEKTRKKVVQKSLDGNVIQIHDSIKDASVAIKVDPSCISDCCRGVQNTSKGFRWEYYAD